MAASPSIAPTRREGIEIRPHRIEPAYENPEGLIEAVKRAGPYRTIYAEEGYSMTAHWPTFRAYWTPTPGKPLNDEVEPFFSNPVFIENAKKAYDAKIVRPFRLVVNLSIPSPGLPAHCDFANYRGIGAEPTWLCNIMSISGLFKRWEIQIASGLAWFYNGEGGEFRYWPDGPEKPAHSEKAPFWNRGIIGDNEYTWHQVCHVGDPDNYLDRSKVTAECLLQWENERWNVIEGGEILESFPFDKVRIMTLWKANIFKDEKEAAIFDQHDNDLDYHTAFQMLTDDLRKRGHKSEDPSDPMNDLEWRKLLYSVYTRSDTPVDIETAPS